MTEALRLRLLLPLAVTDSVARIVLVGGGVAAATAARTLRRLGHAGPITMLCGEGVPPYSRPGLMYALMGHVRPRDLALHSDTAWASLGVDRVVGRAAHLDLGARIVVLADGMTHAFDRLLVATGSRSRRPNLSGLTDFDGMARPGVVGFWGVHDLAPIIAAAARAKASGGRAVVVGGGLSGVELCECLRWLGLDVTFLVREERLLARTLAPHESEMAEAALRRAGVNVRTDVVVAAVDADASGVTGVALSDGGALACGLVGVTVGVEPEVDWLRGSGLALGRGVRVDAALRAMDASGGVMEHVAAAGDVAELTVLGGLVEGLWYTARAQGSVAAHALIGQPRPYAPGVPYNAAKVMDVEWQGVGAYAGPVPEGGESIVLHDPHRRSSLRLVGDAAGALVAVSAMGARIRIEMARAWIAARTSLAVAHREVAALAFDAEFERRRYAPLAA